jgi:hypothetical protein
MSAHEPTSHIGRLDGPSGGDHDEAYTFGRRPSLAAPFPFSIREYARLLALRSRLDTDGFSAPDRLAPGNDTA